MGRTHASMGAGATGLVLAAVLLSGCLPWFPPPDVVSDPANFAAEPWRHRGDRRDREALALLRRRGADLGMRPAEASDEQVVRETLRVVPVVGAAGPRRFPELWDARTMILRRRPRAAYVALGEAMGDADPRVRAGAVRVFADLDSRNHGYVDPDLVPPWTGPERDVALARFEALLADPDRDVRYAVADALQRGIGAPDHPSRTAVRAQVEREQDEEVRAELLRALAQREVQSAEPPDAAGTR